MEKYGIKIDLSRDSLFDSLGLKRLKESYMTEEEESPQERFAYVCKTFGSNAEHAQRLMNIQVNIGYRSQLQFYLLVEAKKECR